MNKIEDILRLSVYAGEIMLRNGAETYRVEETMRYIIVNYGYNSCDCLVTATGISASVTSEADGIKTIVKRVNERSTNLAKVALVNEFSRNINIYSKNFADAFSHLEEIDKMKGYQNKFKILAAGFACLSFSIMFGASMPDAVASLFIGVLAYSFSTFLSRNKVTTIIQILLIGILIGTVASVFELSGLGTNKEIIIIASIMPYIPGLLLTNAVRDIFGGDFLSGGVRIADAVTISVSLATGVGVALKILMTIFN